MRVVQVTPDFPPNCGGIGSYVYYLAREIAVRGHTVSVVYRGKQTRSYIQDSIPVREVAVPGYPPFNNYIFNRALVKILDSEQPDIAHVHSATMPCVRCKCPVVVTSHWCSKEGTRRFYRPISKLDELYRNVALPFYVGVESRLVRHCDRMTVVSESLRQEYLRHYGIDSDVILNGVDPNVFLQDVRIRKLNAILFTGRLLRGKGLLDLLDISELLQASHPDVTVLIIGSGMLYARIVAEMKRRSLFNVRLLGYLSHTELARYYALSRLLVLPTYYEGLPTCILEAMACGLPVVASNVSGDPELVTDAVNGYLVPPGDIGGFHQRISELLDDEAKQRRFGEAGKRIVLSKFTWAHVGRRVLELYAELVNSRVPVRVH